MEVDCLKPCLKESGIMVLARSCVEVPLRRIAAASVAAIESVRLDPTALGAPDVNGEGVRRLDLARLNLPGLHASDRGREGIVVAQTVAVGCVPASLPPGEGR